MPTRFGSLLLVLLGCLAIGCDMGPGFHDHNHGSGRYVSCSSFASCDTCTPVLGCGWCGVGQSGRCVSDPNLCAGNASFTWTWEARFCPASRSIDAGALDAAFMTTDGATLDTMTAPVADASGLDGTSVDASLPPSAQKGSSVEAVLLNAGVSNLATLSFTAPSMGVVSVTATGTCAVESAFPLTTGVSVSIQTQPLGTMSLAGDSLFSVPVAQVGGSYGFTTTRLVNVASGRQDIFLVLNNAAGAGQLRCSAAMTALFTAQSLP